MNSQPVKSYDDLHLKKSVIFCEQARHELQAGINVLADTVRVTLGPLGGSVGLDREGAPPLFTHDGFTASAGLELPSPHHNLGLRLLRQAATATRDTVGDGATTTVVLAQAIVNEGFKYIAAGGNPLFFQRGLLKAAAIVRPALHKLSRPLVTMTERLNVATLACDDPEIGALICHVVDVLGKDGLIWMHDDDGLEISVELAEGMSWKQGYLSAVFVTEQASNEAVLEDAAVLVTTSRLAQAAEIVPLMEQLIAAGKPRLLVIAESVTGPALATLTVNHQRGTLKCLVVKPPAYEAQRRAILHDIAVLTGATLCDLSTGRSLQSATMRDLGRVEAVIASHNRTTLSGGGGSPEAIAARVGEIRRLLAQSNNKSDQDKIQQRLAGFSGGFATIRVGGYTEAQRQERQRLLRKAFACVRAAGAEGVVAGGGVALLNIIPTLSAVKPATADEAAALCCLQKAFELPFRQLVSNAGQDAAACLGQVRWMQQESKNPFVGYDVRRRLCGDLRPWGIYDPTLVVRTAVLNAISVAALILTIEASVGIIPGQTISLAEPPSDTLLRLRAERQERQARYRRLGRQKPPKRVW